MTEAKLRLIAQLGSSLRLSPGSAELFAEEADPRYSLRCFKHALDENCPQRTTVPFPQLIYQKPCLEVGN